MKTVIMLFGRVAISFSPLAVEWVSEGDYDLSRRIRAYREMTLYIGGR